MKQDYTLKSLSGCPKDGVHFYLIDKEMRVYKVDYVRTTRKKSIRTNTHKLINKAVANIQAVEKGILGVGH